MGSEAESWSSQQLTIRFDRFSDSAGAGLRHPQEFHLLPGAANSLGDAQDCQDLEIMGLEDWQEAGGLKGETGEAEDVSPCVRLYRHPWDAYDDEEV